MVNNGNATIRIRFHGVRGSYPVPAESALRYGGNTTCVEVRAGDHHFIFDAGTGIIPLATELVEEHVRTKKPIEICFLLTHTHLDHISGLPFFKPVYLKSSRIAFFGPKAGGPNTEEVIETFLQAPFHPVPLVEMGMQATFTDLEGGEVLMFRPGQYQPVLVDADSQAGPEDAVVRVCFNPNHPKLGAFHYRVEFGGKAFVFATDTEGTEEGEPILSKFAEGADLLAHDAQYTDEDYFVGPPPKKGWGHSTYKMACAAARRAGVRQLALIHHEPERDDRGVDAIEEEAKKLFAETFAAREGMLIDL